MLQYTQESIRFVNGALCAYDSFIIMSKEIIYSRYLCVAAARCFRMFFARFAHGSIGRAIDLQSTTLLQAVGSLTLAALAKCTRKHGTWLIARRNQYLILKNGLPEE